MSRDPRSRDDRTLAVVLLLVVGAVAAAFGWWRWHEARAPRLLEVGIVLRPDGDPIASDGELAVAAEARVEAAVLVSFVQGSGPVRRLCAFPTVSLSRRPASVEPLAAWPRGHGILRATWFTVEPALFGWGEVAAATADKLAYKDFLAPEMGTALAARVSREAHNDDFLSRPLAGNTLGGGFVRLKVRVGAYRRDDDVLAYQAVSSPGADAIWDGSVPRVLFAADLPAGVSPSVSTLLRLACFTFAAGVWPDGGPGWPLPVTPREAVGRSLIATPEALAAAASGDPLAPRWRSPVPVRRGGGRVLAAGGAPLRWARDVDAGDVVSGGGRFAVLVRDDGDSVLSAADTALSAWNAPALLAPLADVLPGDDARLELLRRR